MLLLRVDTAASIGINQLGSELPRSFSLHQNYPNPFNPETKIAFEISEGRHTKITIFNAEGKAIDNLVNKFIFAGVYELSWNASLFPSGIYFYKLETEGFTQTKKMILIK
jgi:hypothetical protein